MHLIGVVLVLLGASLGVARERSLPPSLTAAIIVRVVAFETSERDGPALSIHVLDDETLAKELKGHVGVAVGSRTLTNVSFGANLPAGDADVVIATKKNNLSKAIKYSKEVGAISVATDPALAALGVSLVVFDDEGMPGVLLNRAAAKREGLHWEPEILQIAQLTGE